MDRRNGAFDGRGMPLKKIAVFFLRTVTEDYAHAIKCGLLV